MKKSCLLVFWVLATVSCNLSGSGPEPVTSATQSTLASTSTGVQTTELLPPATEAMTAIPAPTASATPSPLPVVESLKAKVSAELLSCRYGPGAEYLYLYALRAGANIKLIGRTDGNDWVWVDGTNKCWVKASFLEIAGERGSLPIVYPGIAKLPITPYYPAPAWVKATREGSNVKITWQPVPISPGKYEDENMHQYIVEVWRCENGQIRFETLGTNFPFLTVENDQPGCAVPSHGTLWLQEKHGFAGPVEIPWPPYPSP